MSNTKGGQMSKRVTIMIDEDLDSRLRNKQARIIQTTHSTCSYSRVLNETLRKSMR
jgi:organic hydroperoxide reductase OsmC/OhrA